MKTYRKRFMASTLALLMTVSIPLTALAEENTGTEDNDLEISQEFNSVPVSEPAGAPADPATPSEEDIKNAKDALDGAIKAAKEYQKTDDYKKSKLSTEKQSLEGDIHAAENVQAALEETRSKENVESANRVANTLNTNLQDLQSKIREEKAKDALDKAKKELEQAIDNAEAFQSNEKYIKGLEADKTAFDQALKDARTAKNATSANVDSLTTAKNTLTVAQKKLEDATLPIASTLAISGQKVSSNGYVSGYVEADGLAVEGAKVTFYTNDGVYVNDRKTDANGYFEFKVGTEYYNYYYYWYGKDYRCGKSGYLLAEKPLYTTSEKAYVKGSCDYNNYYWQGSYDNKYYDYRVYPTSISRTTSYVKGYLPNEKGRTVSVYSNDYYYDGYYSDGYYDSYGNWHYYNYYNGYYNRYYRNSNYYLGSATVDSDGYFTIYFNRSVPTSESLYYYVDGYKDGRYATAPSVSQAEAGTMFIKGKAGSYASIRVEDANGTKIGTTTANGDGEFACYLDRKLSLNETIKVIASESSKYDSQTTYKVVDTSLSGQTYARVSYIKGYPDGTFKPSNNVTRAEAAQMFATLLNNGTSFGTSSVTKFTDANNKWYSPAVNYIAGKGLLSGYSDGTFKPDADITRAEFAQMISGYLKAGYAGSANFKDVKGHWASDAIDKVFGNKAVEGYPDGTFKPNKTLTRAEAVTVLNAVFNRYTTSSSLNNVSSANLKNYSDISSSHWAYYQILDASNAHVSQKVTSTSNEEVWK